MFLTSSIYNHFIIWPSIMTLDFNLHKQMFLTAPLLLKDNICAKLFWNPCINVPVMARTSSINLWPFWPLFDPCDLDLQLTWNVHMALLLFEVNNCAKLFWNPCMNVQVKARKSSIYDHFDFAWPLLPWPWTYLKKYKLWPGQRKIKC